MTRPIRNVPTITRLARSDRRDSGLPMDVYSATLVAEDTAHEDLADVASGHVDVLVRGAGSEFVAAVCLS